MINFARIFRGGKIMKQVGKILLLISGICLLAVGVWSLITAVLGLIAIIAGAVAGDEVGMTALILGIVLFVVSLLTLLFYVFAGVRGIKTYTKGDDKNIHKAFVWAIIILVLNVASLFLNGGTSGIVGLVIDVAYITGAFMVKLSK